MAGAFRITAAKRGQQVKISAEGSAHAGLIGQIERIDSKGRIEILMGMARVKVPADMVVLA